jgi:arsenite-transporting ATPase
VRLVLYTGKGGVGKTTTAAATAVRAAELGRRTLVASADAAHSLGDVLERRLGPRPAGIAPRLAAAELDARVEVGRHWGRIRDFLVELFRHQGIETVVAEELALLPGVEELATLLAVDELSACGAWDLVVVDCAPSDAALRLLTLPELGLHSLRLLLPAFAALAGVAVPLARRVMDLPLPGAEVFGDADELVNRRLVALRRRVSDPRTSVRIVVTPERLVIDEARRTWTELALFEVGCDAIVMNRLLPEAALREEFFRDWCRLQEERCREVAEIFAPQPVLPAPLQEDEVTGLERLSRHAAALFAAAAPDAILSRAPRVRFERSGADYRVRVPLPGARARELDVVKLGDELLLTAGSRRRALKLPRRLASLHLAGARLEGAELAVTLRREPGGGAAARPSRPARESESAAGPVGG